MNVINNVAVLEFNSDERELLHKTSTMLMRICQDVEADTFEWEEFDIRKLKRISEIFQEASNSGKAYLHQGE